ncbi:MAG: DUF3107 domain-containing protein [Micrococcaceae bacterium]
MEIKIGIQNTPRELVIETEDDIDAIQDTIIQALDSSVLTLKDSKGKTTIIPSKHISYIEIGAEEHRQVGFGAL